MAMYGLLGRAMMSLDSATDESDSALRSSSNRYASSRSQLTSVLPTKKAFGTPCPGAASTGIMSKV